MSDLTGEERARYVHNVFGGIARRYNLMNRLMTAGQDMRWRREAIRRLGLRPGERLLDLGAGTGDLGREALRQQPGIHLVAADFSLEMMLAGQASGPLPWLNADALQLPFADGSFEAVVSGFLMRNVGNLEAALKEQQRVLKPGGRILILETTRPRSGILSPFVRFYMRQVIPWIGGLVSGNREAYRYLPASSEGFLSAEELAGRMTSAGFSNVGFHRRMAGTIAIHWGKKSY
jgi:demethylmenaquinone methyltransferase/2-methoxy-6-polyprenyl-1,4-benzoquinol methylase